jgi:hypothetical protein
MGRDEKGGTCKGEVGRVKDSIGRKVRQERGKMDEREGR